MKKNDYSCLIRNRVKRAKAGSVFAMVDFADLAPNNAANRVVTRLAAEGLLTAVVRGVYQKPKYSALLGENVLPEAEEVADALARKCGWTIRADGDTALNQLGLSTQVPARWTYLSDGPYRKYVFRGGQIVFKHAANRLLGNLSRESALVVQALRALGREHLTQGVLLRLAERFDTKTWACVEGESVAAPEWIREAIRRVKELVVEIKHGKKLDRGVIDEVREKVANLEVAKDLSIRTALVYDGELAPSIEADRYFDFLLPFEKLLKE